MWLHSFHIYSLISGSNAHTTVQTSTLYAGLKKQTFIHPNYYIVRKYILLSRGKFQYRYTKTVV